MRVCWLFGIAAIAAISGCGGGGSSQGDDGGIIVPPPADDVSIQATARFNVNVLTGEVTVEPLTPSSRAVFDGSKVRFLTSTLLSSPGNTGRRILSVRLRNDSGEQIGAGGGIRVKFPGGFLVPSDNVDLTQNVLTTTYAGDGVAGMADGPLSSARFDAVSDVAIGPDQALYIADRDNNRIRKVLGGYASVLAGSGAFASVDGAGASAGIHEPTSLCFGIDGALYVTEQGGHKVRRVTMDGSVTTVAGSTSGVTDGPGNLAKFSSPGGIACGPDGTLYVADTTNHRIRAISPAVGDPRIAASYTVSTLAGNGVAGSIDGVGAGARLNRPKGVSVSPNGTIFVADRQGHRIRRITTFGEVTTIAGSVSGSVDGTGATARFSLPNSILALRDDYLLVTEAGTHQVRHLVLGKDLSPAVAANWTVQKLAGTGGAGFVNGPPSQFSTPSGLAEQDGFVYVADLANNALRRLEIINGSFPYEPSGSGVSESVLLHNADGNEVTPQYEPYVTFPKSLEPGETSAPMEWAFSVPEGVGRFIFHAEVEANTEHPAGFDAVINNTSTGFGSGNNLVKNFAGITTPGYTNGSVNIARFNSIYDVEVDFEGNMYVADNGNQAIRRIDVDGTVSTVAGVIGLGTGHVDGLGNVAQFSSPRGLAVSLDGKTLFVGCGNHTVRRIELVGKDPQDPSHWEVSTIAGTPATSGDAVGVGSTATFKAIESVFLDGNVLYTVESDGNRIRRIDFKGGDPMSSSSWFVRHMSGSTTGASGFANGSSSTARYWSPRKGALGADGRIYVADYANHRIRRIDPNGDAFTTAGSGASGGRDGTGLANFDTPRGIDVDDAGYIYVVEETRIRRISPLTGMVMTVAGASTPGTSDSAVPGNLPCFINTDDIEVDRYGNIYVADNNRIRKVQRWISN